MALLKCPRCGESFADSYTSCPFCAEDDEYYNGKLKKKNHRIGQQKPTPSILGPAMILVIILVLLFLVWILFGSQIKETLHQWVNPPVEDTSDDSNPSKPVDVEPVSDDVSLDIPAITLETASGGKNTCQLKVSGSSSVTWASATPTVAVVTDSGLVTAIAPGSCVITVTSESGAEAHCTVTVVEEIQEETAPPAPPQEETVDLSKVKILSGGVELPKSSEDGYTYDVSIKDGTSMKLTIEGTTVTPKWDWDEGHSVVTVKGNTAYADQGKVGRYSTLRCVLGDQTVKIKFHCQ